jgi:hypothetical protein
MTAASTSTRVESGATNPVQRVTHSTCRVCAGPVVRAPKARGPLPSRCPGCQAATRRGCQLRAYLKSARRIAEEIGMHELVELIARAASVADEEKS